MIGHGLGARARHLAAAVRASAWASLLGRGVFLVTGLLVLAWIGRTTDSAGAVVSRREVTIDAGVAPGASAASPVAAPAIDAGAGPRVEPATQASPRPGAGTSRATPDDPVYLNHASADELRRLPGVGPKRADAIVALRQRMGRFRRVEDLLRVKGVGRATVRRWRPLLRLDTPDGGAR